MSQKRYNQEFKQTVVELYRSGTPVSQLSSEYGISEVTIYKWIKLYSPIKGKQDIYSFYLIFNCQYQLGIRRVALVIRSL